MATKKEPTGLRTTPVKIETGLVKKAKMVASDKGMNLSDYVAEALRSIVEKDWSKIVRKMASEDAGN